jgi:hypothetical protein
MTYKYYILLRGFMYQLYINIRLCPLEPGWMEVVRFPTGARNSSVLLNFQTRSTLSPVQWISGAVFLGVKLTTHLHLVRRSRMVELYLHCPVCIHGAMLY